MKTSERREALLKELKSADKAVSATLLAKRYNVSRQVIVGDVAILKALQHPILATARGYIYNQMSQTSYVLVCKHASSDTQDELTTIVDLGGKVVDVCVEHPLYGELRGQLNIGSRYDVDQFILKSKQTDAKQLSILCDGIHLHTIVCENEAMFERIQEALQKKHYLYM